MHRKISLMLVILAAVTGSVYSDSLDAGNHNRVQGKDSRYVVQQVSEGKALIAKSDCFACHKEKEKLVGPAYSEVAKKYPANEANIEKLAQKVIKGGQGVWGQIPMPAHPSLNESDAKKMIAYILKIK